LLLFYLVCPWLFSSEDFTILKEAHSRVRLLAEHDGLSAGSSSKLALQILLEEGWHAYWRNPGDSGAAPIVEWQLPKGYQVSDLNYPLPHRIEMGQLTAIGYEKELLLWVDLAVPQSEELHRGELRKIQISAEWLVCKEECVPAFFDETLTLPVKEESAGSQTSEVFTPLRPLETKRGSFEVLEKELLLELPVSDSSLQMVDLFPFPDLPVSVKKPVFERGVSQIKVRIPLMSAKPVDGNSARFLAVFEDTKTLVKIGFLYEATEQTETLAWMLLFAFLGGLLLNLMPCVFPILALKFYGVFQMEEAEKKEISRAQVYYQIGILVSLWILAGALILIRDAGSSAGWGFHLQSPAFVSFLILLFFLLGLGFLDYLTLPMFFPGSGLTLMSKEGFLGHFFTGVLAVVVASPCTAPFMGTAIGFALTQDALVTLILFTLLGLGLGFPYLLLGFFPSLAKFLPRSGPWMVQFKQFMAFPLFGTCAWLFFVLSSQVEGLRVSSLLGCMVLLSFGIWVFKSLRGWMRSLFLILTLAGLLGLGSVAVKPPAPGSVSKDTLWERFSQAGLDRHLLERRSVFINFTAAWCITCKANEILTFSSDRVQQYLKSSDLVMLKADWTNRDEEIGEFLRRYDRAGVPLYLFYSKGSKKARVLPELLTPEIFLNAVQP
jgi:thiol:disulfide interchange protein DsbD